MDFTHDKNNITDPRKEDFDDLQNEVSGRETGRRARFLPAGEQSAEAKRKKREEERAFRTQLALLLEDPVYRAKYNGVMNALREAEQATEAALDQIAQMISEAQQALQDMEDRAAKLPDGTLVFRDAHGVVRKADGSVVEDHLVETILWTGNEPDFEAYQTQQGQLSELNQHQRNTELYREDVLGSARDKMLDEDTPPNIDELDQLLDSIQNQLPSNIAAEVKSTLPTTDVSAVIRNIEIPKIDG